MLNNAPLLTSEKIFPACANRIRSLSSFISTNDLLCAAKLICEARMCHIIEGLEIQSRLLLILDSAFRVTGNPVCILHCQNSILITLHLVILLITADPNSQIMDFSDAILQINDTNEMHDQNVRADSHLLELAVNDALIYVIKNYPLFNFDDKLPTQINDVELLLSETKF
jgi:RpiR family carbohydrate utilization transcriptional regulator